MKSLLKYLLPFALVAMPFAARAQSTMDFTNVNILTPGSLNINSGGNLTIASGGTMTFGPSAANNKLLGTTTSGGNVALIGLGAGLSISGGNLIAASSTSANPSATIGLSAVNGTAGSFMTSDSAPALSQAIVPTWTGLHTFSVTAVKTSGTDYGMEILPTLNQRNATNFSLIYANETVTQAGTGNQYLEEFAVSGTDKWVVDSTGQVDTGIWAGSVIGQTHGGAGTISGVLAANGSGVVSAASSGTGISISGTTINLASTSNNTVLSNVSGGSAAPAANTLTALIDSALGNTQGDILERGASAWQVIAPGTANFFLQTKGAANDPVWAQVNGGPASTTQHDVASYSNTTGSFEDTGAINATTTVQTFTANNGGNVAFVFNDGANSSPTPIASFLTASLSTGQETGILFGVQNATKNLGSLYFKYNGNGLNTNYIAFGFYGTTDSWTLTPLGAVSTTSEALSGTISASSATTGTLTIGNGTAATNTGIGGGNVNTGGTLTVGGTTTLTGKVSSYNGVTTAGIGVTPCVSAPRTAANTNALWTPAAYTTPASDTSYDVSANILVTATTAAAMTCTCTYTSEDNVSRTLTLGFTQLAGATLLTSITNVTGTGPYESPEYHIRCKASTTITFATVGTVTGITYNAEGSIVQLQ